MAWVVFIVFCLLGSDISSSHPDSLLSANFLAEQRRVRIQAERRARVPRSAEEKAAARRQRALDRELDMFMDVESVYTADEEVSASSHQLWQL